MREEKKSASLLDSYRVLDLTDDTGYLCGKILADMGADVIKIEHPGGDSGRNRGPFYKDIAEPEKSLYWMSFNTNKRGITLDIDSTIGQRILKKLSETADFIIESFQPGYMNRIGLGYESLSEINKRIIMTSITPFGQNGPYKDFKASDMVVWAMGGMMYLCGDEDRAPTRISVPQAYCFGGLHGAVGSLIAHSYREVTGEGQHVDVSVQEAVSLSLLTATEIWDQFALNPSRTGDFYTLSRPLPFGLLRSRYIFPCKDGYVSIFLQGGASTGAAKSCSELTKLAVSEGFALELQNYNWNAMDLSTITQEEKSRTEQSIIPFLLTKTREELHEAAVEKGILLMPVNNIADLSEDPQLAAREYWEEIEHPELKDNIIYPGATVKSSATSREIWRRAPLIGEHNDEIFIEELGFSREELTILEEERVI